MAKSKFRWVVFCFKARKTQITTGTHILKHSLVHRIILKSRLTSGRIVEYLVTSNSPFTLSVPYESVPAFVWWHCFRVQLKICQTKQENRAVDGPESLSASRTFNCCAFVLGAEGGFNSSEWCKTKSAQESVKVVAMHRTARQTQICNSILLSLTHTHIHFCAMGNDITTPQSDTRCTISECLLTLQVDVTRSILKTCTESTIHNSQFTTMKQNVSIDSSACGDNFYPIRPLSVQLHANT